MCTDYCLNIIIVLFIFFKVIMDVLDLEVSTEEIQTLNEDIRPAWDKKGMTCPVVKCPSHYNTFKTFRSYMAHWTKNICVYQKLFKCSICRKTIQPKHKAQHIQQHAVKTEFSIMTVLNKEYTDPESYVPAKHLKSNTEDQKNPAESPRKIAQRKRKLEVQKSIQNTTILSENLDPDINNSRDEKLYFLESEERTTVTYHKNPRWAKNAPVEPLKTKKSFMY